MITSSRDCPHCKGSAVLRDTSTDQPTFKVLGPCVDCAGDGVVCTYCGKPAAACECVTVQVCADCGKLPWACQCRENSS